MTACSLTTRRASFTHIWQTNMSAAAKLPPAGQRSLGGNERFNDEAAAWDSNPFVHSASAQALAALQQKHANLLTSTTHILEIGCGTGLLTLLVAPHVASITAVDAAQGMISALERKLTQPKTPKNVLPVCVLLEDPEDPALPPQNSSEPDGARLKFDLILSHLVLHHIPDLRPLLETMLGCLKPGASIAPTDFEDFGPQARRFHSAAKRAGVERDGIPRAWMEGLMREVGFVDIDVQVRWTMEKKVEKMEGEFDANGGKPIEGMGEVMEFPFLVCLGKRPT